MSAMTYLQRRKKSGIYRFRRSVPPELQEAIGKRNITKTFQTTKVNEAKRKAMEFATEVDRLFASVRSGVSLSLADAELMAMAWKVDALAESAEEFANMDTQGRSWTDIEHHMEAREPFVEAERRDLATRAVNPYVVEQAKAALAKQGLALPEDNPSFRRLCFALHRALIEVQKVNGERMQGNWTSETQQHPAPVVVVPALSPLVQPVSRRSRDADGKPDATLSAILDRWAKNNRPGPKVLSEFTSAVRRFNESLGAELMVRDITKQHVMKFLDAIRELPRAMPNKLREKTLPEILTAVSRASGAGTGAAVPRISSATVIKYHGAIHALLRSAKKLDFADINAAEDLKPADAGVDRTERRLPFDAADLKTIFEQSPVYTGSRTVSDAEYWLPLLALYTGARLDELGQLLLTDVKHEDGIDYLDLNTLDEGKKLKTGTSRRRVPLHPELVRCGFLRYVGGLRASKDRQVFPSLRPDKMGSWTAALSKKLNRYLNDVGITDRRKVIHSFRHSFKDACRQARIPEAVHDALTGHSNGSVGRRYGRGEPLDVLAEAVAKISYPVKLKRVR
jgi:integrase